MRTAGDFLFLFLFFVLFAAWGFTWLVLHIATGAIHLLLILAVAALVVHVMRRLTAA